MISGYELSGHVKSDFDYMDNVDDGTFIKYKNNYYDVAEFMLVGNNDVLKDWDGYRSDSYFSGVVIKLVDDDQCIMGMYYS